MTTSCLRPWLLADVGLSRRFIIDNCSGLPGYRCRWVPLKTSLDTAPLRPPRLTFETRPDLYLKWS